MMRRSVVTLAAMLASLGCAAGTSAMDAGMETSVCYSNGCPQGQTWQGNGCVGKIHQGCDSGEDFIHCTGPSNHYDCDCSGGKYAIEVDCSGVPCGQGGDCSEASTCSLTMICGRVPVVERCGAADRLCGPHSTCQPDAGSVCKRTDGTMPLNCEGRPFPWVGGSCSDDRCYCGFPAVDGGP